MKRLFLAINLPESLIMELQNLRFYLPTARWTMADQYHLTLLFLGELHGGQFRDLQQVLTTLIAQWKFPSFPLRPQGVGAFHSRREARTLWVGMEKNRELERLQKKLQQGLSSSDLDLDLEQRKFTPHITLARLHQTPIPKVASFLETFGSFQSPPFTVNAIHLYSSLLTAKGAHYACEATYSLS